MNESLKTGKNCLQVPGDIGWMFAADWAGSPRYLKEVDADEVTLRFWQEIYDDQGRLVEVHQRFPVDTGHRKA